jgi:hypothetical protein
MNFLPSSRPHLLKTSTIQQQEMLDPRICHLCLWNRELLQEQNWVQYHL